MFETDDENKVIENKSSVNKENNKLDKNKINSNKPERDNFKVADKENNLIEDLVIEKKVRKELSSNNDSSSGLKKQKTNNDISLETDLSFSEKQIPDSEKFAFYKKEIDPPKAEKVKKNFMKIGMLLPLTGEKKAAGDLVMNSLRYNMNTKPTNLVFKIYDTKGLPSGAVKAAQSGLDEGIKIFIGPIFSDETKELNNYFSDEDAKFFSLSPDFSNISENVIVSGENPDDQVSCIKKNLLENDLEKVLLIHPRNKYGQVIKQSFQKKQSDKESRIKIEFFELSDAIDLNEEIKILSRFEKRKMELDEEIERVRSDNSLKKKEKDFQLKNLEKQLTLDVPFDAVVIASQGDKLVEVLSHLAFYDINSQNTFIYGTSLWEDTNKLDKVFQGTFYVTSLKTETETFKKDFREIFSKDPLSFNFYIYDLIDFVSQYEKIENNRVYAGEFSNSKINSGLLRRETYLKKVLNENRVLNISSCSLSEL